VLEVLSDSIDESLGSSKFEVGRPGKRALFGFFGGMR